MSNYFYYKDNFGDHYLSAALSANFTNCIVYGSLNESGELDRDYHAGAAFDYLFDHCDMLLADSVDITTSHFNNVIKNKDPLFVDAFSKDDYHLLTGSPCIDAGTPNSIPLDLDGITRTGNPDIGCYEFH